jgi:gas vesicle structural protein
MEERDIRLRAPRDEGTLIDVLDRVLDKGIVIEAWARVSLVGIDLMTLEMNMVVASIDTYLMYSDKLLGDASSRQ